MRIPGRVRYEMKRVGKFSNNAARRVIAEMRQRPEQKGEECKGLKPKYRRSPPNRRR